MRPRQNDDDNDDSNSKIIIIKAHANQAKRKWIKGQVSKVNKCCRHGDCERDQTNALVFCSGNFTFIFSCRRRSTYGKTVG